MTFKINHQLYAATQRTGGFGVFYQSDGISRLESSEEEIIRRNAAYTPPFSLNDTNLSLYPVNYAFYHIDAKNGRKAVLLFSRYTGATNHTPDRQGNFLTHTIVFDDALESIPLPELFDGLPFRNSLTIEEERHFEKPQESFELIPGDAGAAIAECACFLQENRSCKNILLNMLDDIMDGWLNTKGHNITVCAPSEEICRKLFFSLYTIVPSFLMNQYSFATYTSNPVSVPFQICGVIRECDVKELDPKYFKLYDVEKQSSGYTPRWQFTKTLKKWIDTLEFERIAGLSTLLADYKVKKIGGQMEVPFVVDTFKSGISRKKEEDLRDILSLFSPSQGGLKRQLLDFVREKNPDLFIDHLITEMRDELRRSASLSSSISIIEKNLLTFAALGNERPLTEFYQLCEKETASQSANLAASLLMSNDKGIRSLLDGNRQFQSLLLDNVEFGWDKVSNKERFLFQYEDKIIEGEYPNIRFWTAVKHIESDVRQGYFIENYKMHKATLSKLPFNEVVGVFVQAIGRKNERGEFSTEFLSNAAAHIQGLFKEPSVVWKKYFDRYPDRNDDAWWETYSREWRASSVRRNLIVIITINWPHHLFKYEEIIRDCDEYDRRWMLEQQIERHNKRGFELLRDMMPKPKNGFFKRLFSS